MRVLHFVSVLLHVAIACIFAEDAGHAFYYRAYCEVRTPSGTCIDSNTCLRYNIIHRGSVQQTIHPDGTNGLKKPVYRSIRLAGYRPPLDSIQVIDGHVGLSILVYVTPCRWTVRMERVADTLLLTLTTDMGMCANHAPVPYRIHGCIDGVAGKRMWVKLRGRGSQAIRLPDVVRDTSCAPCTAQGEPSYERYVLDTTAAVFRGPVTDNTPGPDHPFYYGFGSADNPPPEARQHLEATFTAEGLRISAAFPSSCHIGTFLVEHYPPDTLLLVPVCVSCSPNVPERLVTVSGLVKGFGGKGMHVYLGSAAAGALSTAVVEEKESED